MSGPILEAPVLDSLTAELVRPGPYFTLGRSVLGGPDELAPAAGFTWSELLGSATGATITRAATREGLAARAQVGTLTLTLRGVDPLTDPDLRPNVPVRVRHRDGAPMFTGVVENVTAHYDERGVATCTLTAVDGTAALAATTRYGARTPGADAEPWYSRAGRLASSSPVASLPVPASAVAKPVGPSWSYSSTLAQAQAEAAAWAPDGTAAGVAGNRYITPPAGSSWTRELDGLTPGVEHRVVLGVGSAHADYPGPIVLSVDGLARPTVAYAAYVPTLRRYLEARFIPTAPTATLTVPLYASTPRLESLSVTSTQVERCADVLTEAPLTEHLDLVATTARKLWAVDRAGLLAWTDPLVESGAAPVVTFTPDGAGGTVPYLRPTVSYDTRAVVNTLELRNLGVGTDPDTLEPVGLETAAGPFLDTTSRATWGVRSAGLVTCLPPERVSSWGAETVAAAAEPGALVTAVRVNAAGHESTMAGLDLHARAAVQLRGVTYQCRVAGITHELTPGRWIVTVALSRRNDA